MVIPVNKIISQELLHRLKQTEVMKYKLGRQKDQRYDDTYFKHTIKLYSPVTLSQDSQQLYISLPLSVSNDAVAPEILFY